jgi:DUF4097 and DUF4098 domain-containing protein YvlB
LLGDVVQEEREWSFLPSDDGWPVSVHNENGDVAVSTHNGQRVVVDALVTAPSEERLGDVTVDGDASNGEFVVAVRVDGDSSRVSADLDVQVPEGTEMASVQSENGDVDVRGVASVSVARSRNGDVSVRDAGPFGTARTENGDVDAELPAPRPGDVTVRSTNGDAEAMVSPDVDAALVASTRNGDVEVNGLDLTDSQVSETEIRGVLGEGTHEVTVASENGDVTVGALD